MWKTLAAAFALILILAAPAVAQEVTVVKDIEGPEGPLVVDGALYYVGWVSNGLYRWDGKTSVLLNSEAGCSHNGLALTKAHTFLLACTADPGSILELDLSGKVLRRWTADDRGRPLAGGVNDVTVAPGGGAYATLFGSFTDGGGNPGELIGKVLYLPPGGGAWRVVAENLNYANGVAVSPDGRTLYVDETVGNCILKFRIEPDGSLSHRSNFALLGVLAPTPAPTAWLGPDSLKVASDGSLYVAQLTTGRVLKLSPEGKLLHTFPIAAGLAPTNVAFAPGEREFYVTVVRDLGDPKARGSIVRLANVP